MRGRSQPILAGGYTDPLARARRDSNGEEPGLIGLDKRYGRKTGAAIEKFGPLGLATSTI